MPKSTRHTPLFGTMTTFGGIGRRGTSRLHAVAAAALLSAGLMQHDDALALALGRVAVQSSLGEPLRAEVDVLEITPEEASSLRVGLAAPEAFRSSGMDLSSAIAGLQITLQRQHQAGQHPAETVAHGKARHLPVFATACLEGLDRQGAWAERRFIGGELEDARNATGMLLAGNIGGDLHDPGTGCRLRRGVHCRGAGARWPVACAGWSAAG